MFLGKPNSSQDLNQTETRINREFTELTESQQTVEGSSDVFSLLDKNDVEFGVEGASAVPELSRNFFFFLPEVLFNIFSSSYVLYFLIALLLQLYRDCEGISYVLSLIETIILLIVIFLEIYIRAETYSRCITLDLPQCNEMYDVWSKEKGWQKIPYIELKAGQIILLKRFLNSKSNNPVTLLPLCVASGTNYLSCKTIWLNKQQDIGKIWILPMISQIFNYIAKSQNFKNNFDITENIKENSRKLTRSNNLIVEEERKDESLEEEVKIGFEELANQISDIKITLKYDYQSSKSEEFEAALNVESRNKKLISHLDILPPSVPILNENWIIGMALVCQKPPLESQALKIINSRTKLESEISLFIKKAFLLNFLFIVVIYTTILMLTLFFLNYNPSSSYYLCLLINSTSEIFLSVCPIIMIVVKIKYIIAVFETEKNENIRIKSLLHSVDEFAGIDVLIVDDPTSLEILPEDFGCVLNQSVSIYEEKYKIFELIKESKFLKEELYGHILPICKHFSYQEENEANEAKRGKIIKEIIINESCIELVVKLSFLKEKQVLRLNDRPILSGISNLKNEEVRREFEQILMKINDNHEILYVEIKLNEKWIPFCLSKFLRSKTDDYFYEIKQNDRLCVILTEKSWKYLNTFIKKEEELITIEEEDENLLNDIIRSEIKKIKSEKKKKVVYFSSNIINFLSRNFVIGGLKEMAVYCEIIIFHYINQYEKEIGAAHLFKIFPEHVFMSNYSVNANIFKMSNLSACLESSSASEYAIAVLSTSKDINKLTANSLSHSIQVTNYLLHTMIFKNNIFIFSTITTFILTFMGTETLIGFVYTSNIHIFYNLFSIFPLIYSLVYSNDNKNKVEINSFELIEILFLSALYGIFLALLLYSLIDSSFFTSLYFAVLIDSIIISNLYHVYKDESTEKIQLVLITLLQIIISSIFLVTNIIYAYNDFSFINSDTELIDEGPRLLIVTFLVSPFIAFLFFYAIELSKKVIIDKKIFNEDTEIIAEIEKSSGKIMKFREE